MVKGLKYVMYKAEKLLSLENTSKGPNKQPFSTYKDIIRK